MKSEPTELSPLETECLFGETVEVLDEYLDWVYCKLVTDNYHGWVLSKGLNKSPNSTHRVLVKRSFIYMDKSPKSNCLFYVPMGAQLVIDSISSGWAKVKLYGNAIQTGYVPSKHIVTLSHTVKDWVAVAQQLSGTPYKWGGRDSVGIDCSALLQLSYQAYGKSIPRNSSEQIKLKKNNIENIDNLKRGCVIFWEGHVAIMIDDLNCIHANAYHMQTKTEPLNEVIRRLDKSLKIIKMMDFN